VEKERGGISRRTVLRAGAAGLAIATSPRVAAAAAPSKAAYVPRPDPTQYTLRVAGTALDPDGQATVTAITANGTLPGPEIRARQGEQLRILVENQLDDQPTTIHWHGVLVPAGMDGVPQVSNAPIAARRTYVYEYPLRQSGTYWYHSHYGFQEQRGLFGPLIIEDGDDARDAVVMVSDWLHRDPTAVYQSLKKTPAETPGMNMASMKMADLADVDYDAFLLNGRGPAQPWTFAAKPGERIRLRLINAGASTYFRLRLDGHRLQVTHADGLAVEPVTVDHLLMGMGETYDASVTLSASGSYTLHAVAQDGSGQALGVLHTPDVAPAANPQRPRFDDGTMLTYAMLRAPAATTLADGPQRSFDLPLQGDMARYVWMLGGQVYPQADPLLIRQGDRVEVVMKNETGMWHPMHLHGHYFRLLQGGGDRCPLKHTVNVAPGETARIEFTADNPGNWIVHCHNLYHFEAGMGRVFQYEV
jgi:FtsP/CotA-like multicopper oxidase with cupredoxin domain